MIVKSITQALDSSVRLASLVKISHTVFALPFAMSMLLVVSRDHVVGMGQLVWILLALVFARTSAMAFNRLIDRKIDAENPRTQSRELPRGSVTVRQVCLLLIFSIAGFLISAAALGIHCLMLSPLVMGILLFYSYTKRFTSFSHIVLGVSLALAPGGVWYAITAQFAVLPIYLMLGVGFWVAGFDIIYSCQDCEFDKSRGLHSVPSQYGIPRALVFARLLHLIAVFFLIVFGIEANLPVQYFLGLGLFSWLVASQHTLVRADDLSRVDAAFFTRNGLASLVYLLTVITSVYL